MRTLIIIVLSCSICIASASCICTQTPTVTVTPTPTATPTRRANIEPLLVEMRSITISINDDFSIEITECEDPLTLLAELTINAILILQEED